jgi:hypothetical protein
MSTAPVVLEQDPTIVPAAVTPDAAEVLAPVAPVPVPEVKWHVYQPKDAEGRSIGGQQRISYTTQEELIEKLTHNHEESIRGLRDVRRKQRLGITEPETLPDDLDRLARPVRFAEKELSLEERFQISQELNDPAKFTEARDRLFESAVGVKPAELRETLNKTQVQTAQLVAAQNARTWVERHPEFNACEENVTTICEWMVKTGLQPTVRNFEFAQAKMEEAGLLLPSPIVREVLPVLPVTPVVPVAEVVPQPQVPAPESTRISEVPVPQEKRQSIVPSGLNNRIAPNSGGLAPEKTATLTLRDVENMSSDEYRKNLSNPEFRKRVEELEAARPPRPRR